MDFNLCAALWYAACGSGKATTHIWCNGDVEPARFVVHSADPFGAIIMPPALRYSDRLLEEADQRAVVRLLEDYEASLLSSQDHSPRVCADKSTISSPYLCRARLCFSGAGADELLLGYGRRRSVYERMTKEGLTHHDSMRALSVVALRDMKRWPTRNGARDDRCVGDHGRELRLPFLTRKLRM